jgi:L-amino acid N-acyltransferase YncA
MDNLQLRCPTNLDSALILEWRNSIEVRNASGNQNSISPEIHEKWFAARLDKVLDEPFWIVEHANEPIGFVRLDLIKPSNFEISVVISQNARGNGFGKSALESSILEFRKNFNDFKLTARIRKENFASLSLFLGLDFFQILDDGEFLILENEIVD